MAIACSTFVYRSPTRVRLVFSNTLAVGAFVTSFYTLESLDDLGATPIVLAAIAVAGVPNELELALAPPLVDSARYAIHVAAGVPAADASTAPAADFALGTPIPRQAASAEIPIDDVDALVFGEDLLWRNGDFVESPDGDLQLISGPDNAIDALKRRAISNGLPHKPDFGGHLRASVDAPMPLVPTVAARTLRELRADDRVTSAEIQTSSDPGEGTALLEASVVLVGKLRRGVSLGGPNAR